MANKGGIRWALYLVVTLGILLSLLAGCSGSAAPAAKDSGKAAEKTETPQSAKSEVPKAVGNKEPYKVAWVGSLTGAFGAVGSAIKKGVDLKIDAVNKAGGIDGHPIDLIVYDDQSKAEDVVQLFKKAAEQDKVLAIFGPVPSVQVIPTQPIARSLNTPWLFFGSVMPTAEDKYMFSVINTVDQLVETYIAYISKQGWKRVAGLHPTDDLSNRASAAMKSIAPKYGVEIVGEERYGLKDTDIVPQVTKLKGLNPQAVIAWGTGDPAVLAYRNARQVGLDAPMFLNTSAASSNFFNLTGDVPKKGLLYTGGVRAMYADQLPASDPAKDKAKAFRTAFMAKYNDAPGANEAWGFDSAEMVVDAITKVGPDRAKIDAYLSDMKFDGVGGTYVRKASDVASHVGMDPSSFVIITAEGKQWVKAD